MEGLPSRSALVRIGKALAAGSETEAQLDQLDVLLGRCDEVKAEAVDRLIVALAGVHLASGGALSVRGRTKTLVTLREKLVRMGGHQLPVIRDLAGLRIVGDMTLDEQDEVLVTAAAALGVDQDDIKVIDRRAEPVQGYRALHGEVVIEGVRVEIQVRTVLQHEWAELYERAGDRFGRSIRYAETDHPPKVAAQVQEMISGHQLLSDNIAVLEGGTPMTPGLIAYSQPWLPGNLLRYFPDPLSAPREYRNLIRELISALGNIDPPGGKHL